MKPAVPLFCVSCIVLSLSIRVVQQSDRVGRAMAEPPPTKAISGFVLNGQGHCRTMPWGDCKTVADNAGVTVSSVCKPWSATVTCTSLDHCADLCRSNSDCAAFAWLGSGYTSPPAPSGCHETPVCIQYIGREHTAASYLGNGISSCYAKPEQKVGIDLGQWLNSSTPQSGYACGYGNGWCGCSCGNNWGERCTLPPMQPGTQGGHTCGCIGNLCGCAEAHNTLLGCPMTSSH